MIKLTMVTACNFYKNTTTLALLSKGCFCLNAIMSEAALSPSESPDSYRAGVSAEQGDEKYLILFLLWLQREVVISYFWQDYYLVKTDPCNQLKNPGTAPGFFALGPSRDSEGWG